jgi:hypothetical protein
MTTQTLESLIQFCSDKKVSHVVFYSLLKQLEHRQEVPIQDVAALLGSKQKMDPLVLTYISAACLSAQNTTLNLSVVLTHISMALEANQLLIITALITQLRIQLTLPFNTHDLSETVKSLVNYLQYLLQHKKQDTQLMEVTGRFIVMLSTSLPVDVVFNPLTAEQNEVIKTFILTIQEIVPDMTDDLGDFADKVMRKNSMSIRQSMSVSAQVSTATHYAFMKTNKLPKLLWINSSIQNWKTHSPNFLQAFDQFVKVKTNQNILNELLTVAFEGYVVGQQERKGSPLFARNWKLFLLKRIPPLIGELKLKSTESSLVNALTPILSRASQTVKAQNSGNSEDMFSSFPSTVTDIRHEFLRSCIALQLLPQSSFATILKQDAAVYGGVLPTTDQVFDSMGSPIDIGTQLKQTLVDINPEFTSLEDSGLLEFLQSIDNMEGTKQLQTARLITELIEGFINSEDTEHIYRLCLGLALSLDSLHSILFHVSPFAILKPVMNYLDRWQNNVEESNFQDTHSAFGCIFLFFMLIVKEFNISLVHLLKLKDSTESESFCINYLIKLSSSSSTNPSVALNQHKSEVLSGWTAALFDSGGISDDLMRLSTAQECFELFPIIFQQAFIACKQNLDDIETVKGGLEYFLQPSLMGTIVGIVSWCDDYLWRAQDVEVIIELLKTLITPSELSGESIHIHRIILSIYGPKLYKTLSSIDSSISNNIKIDPVLLSNIHQSIKDGKSLDFFEVETSNTFASLYTEHGKNSRSSLMNAFNSQFQLLLNWGQSSVIPPYDHQFLPNMITLLGINTVVDYFLSQIMMAQQSTSKNSQTVLELAAFILTIEYVGFSSHEKRHFITALKEEAVTKKESFDLPGLELVQELISRKKIYRPETPQGEIYEAFYDKIIETAQTMHSLN